MRHKLLSASCMVAIAVIGAAPAYANKGGPGNMCGFGGPPAQMQPPRTRQLRHVTRFDAQRTRHKQPQRRQGWNGIQRGRMERLRSTTTPAPT